ncbi:urease-associated protein [Rhizobium rhizosphaerae]|uniref:Urease-associated protein n=1 Tax=Xaviernesmea rhizosphaerae TaxID=1672749 RepID=A0ABX3P7Y5_9HYPH|nr:TIGR02117 family protein [Xaviernesmea rhizosphaerae]OQP83718.1 urease-associated protein [Xaviernesmea rhizosphaerae]
MHSLKRMLLGLLIIAAIAAAGTLIPRPLLPRPSLAADGAARQVLVLSNPIHTDLAFPLDDETLARFPFLEASGLPVRHPLARWVIFGWGGRSFYLETPSWAELKALPVLRSLTVDQSVMHVEVLGEIDLNNPAVYSLSVGEDDFAHMAGTIAESFRMAGGKPEVIFGRSYGRSDLFFEANGRFNALLGCNTWTARVLRDGGLRTGFWNPLPASLTLSLSLFNK